MLSASMKKYTKIIYRLLQSAAVYFFKIMYSTIGIYVNILYNNIIKHMKEKH